jgi:carboxylesterase
LRGLRRIRSGLAQITCPVLVLHALKDKTVPVDNAWEVIRRTSSSYRELRIFSILETVTSHHVLTTHCETRDQIAEAVLGFLSRDKSSQTGKIQYYD